MFPTGAPGFALLVLRCTIVVGLTASAFPTGWRHAAYIVLLVCLALGLFTPIACVLVGVAVMVDVLGDPHARVFQSILILLSALSYAFLGPGAYSIDAALFGRRKLMSSDSTRRHSK